MSTIDDRRAMARALDMARRGEGSVEPNPMVGCVLVRSGAIVGSGWHRKYGGPHAEVDALAAAGEAARGATAYVTLEPCCHTGKTPPCTQALLNAGVARVVAACVDPNPAVRGGGLAELSAAGVQVDVGVLQREAAELIAPFAKLVVERRPWVIAKWAMTLDGKLATRAGDSRWISSKASRAIVHQIRGRVDAILVGRASAAADDPLLTARPSGPRLATRIVLDSSASLALESQLVRTAHDAPVLVAAAHDAPPDRVTAMRRRGVEVWQSDASDRDQRLAALLDELGRRQMTNLLVEGGAEVLGSLFDLRAVDEVHAFVAPKVAGGDAATAVRGRGVDLIAQAWTLADYTHEIIGGDAYIRGRLARGPRPGPDA